MAGNIKGITIEIDGNTSKFQKALSDANKAVRATERELKEVNKLLKLDPKNTELLKQKQELLKKSIDEVAKRLEIEKKGLEELAKQDKTPEVTDAMNKLERQIAADEKALEDAKKEFKDFGSVAKQQAKAAGEELEKTGKKISEVGGKIQGVGDGLTKNVTAPIVATGAAALAAFDEVDSGYDTVIKKTGAAGDAAQEMYDIVDKLATSIPTDFATAGEAVGEVNTRFGVTGEKLEKLSGQFIKFAQLNDTDVTSSVDNVQKALAAFGLGADEASGYLDVLNKAAQDSGISVDKLTQLAVANAPAFDAMGVSLDDATMMMAGLEKSGVPVETVIGGLSKALKQAAKDGKPLSEALADLQTEIEGTGEDTDGLTAAYELFGKSGDKIYKAVKDGSLDFENLGTSASNAANSVSTTFDETLDPIDTWKTTLNQLKLTGAELGSTIGEVLQPALEKIADSIKTLKEKWDELSPETKNMIVTVAGIVAVIGPIVAIIGGIVTGIGSLITAAGAVSAALGVAAGTIGIVIAAITAIIAAIVLLILNWDKVKKKVQEVWQAIKEYVTNLKNDITRKWEEIKQQIGQKIESIRTNMSEKWNQIKTDAANKVNGLKDDVVQKLTDLKTKATEKLNDIKDKFKEKFEAIKDKVKDIVDKIKGFFENLTLKIPKPEMPKLPHFSLRTSTRTVFGKEITYPSGIDVDWYAKAMQMPYMFTQPTIMQTPYGNIGAGEAGNELMYGHDNLMRDISNAVASGNASLYDVMYSAISAALDNADMQVVIGQREFGRILREAGAL